MTNAQANDPWDESTPTWLRSAMPSGPSGGILGMLGYPSPFGVTGGVLGDLAQAAEQPPTDPSSATTRPLPWNTTLPAIPFSLSLADLSEPPNGTWSKPAWWPVSANANGKFPAPPAPDVNAVQYSPPDEAAAVQAAARAAWDRLGKRERRAVAARSPAPDTEADAGDFGLKERMRLNVLDSYYRGTLTGARRLAYLGRLASTPDADGISSDLKRARDDLRREYRQVTSDLERYDRMQGFGSASELGATTLGQLGGGMLSPESWLGLGAKGAHALWRAGKAALQQGAITGFTDPIVQGLNIKAGVQDEYDPLRTGAAFGRGAAMGGGAQLGKEALSRTAEHFLPPAPKAIESMRYNHARKTLRELDPTNPNLPTFWRKGDRRILDQEIAKENAKLKKERKLRILEEHHLDPKKFIEEHHLYPQEFKNVFRTWGIEPNDYVMFVEKRDHRLLPDGLHTRHGDWNRQWQRFIKAEREPTEELAINQLYKMMKRIPWMKP